MLLRCFSLLTPHDIDVRKKIKHVPNPVYIKVGAAERVDTHEYLGVTFDGQICWEDAIVRPAVQENNKTTLN